jgi:hypothetical protein
MRPFRPREVYSFGSAPLRGRSIRNGGRGRHGTNGPNKPWSAGVPGCSVWRGHVHPHGGRARGAVAERTPDPSPACPAAAPGSCWTDAPPLHRGREGLPEQPEGGERSRPPRRRPRGDGGGGGGQVVPRLRRALRRGPPPLRGDLQPLRPAVPGAARPAPGRAHRGRAPRGGGGPHRSRADLAVHGRHHDLGRRLHARALGAGGHAALPELRPARAAGLAVLDLRSPRGRRRGAERARVLPPSGGRAGGDRRRAGGLREGGLPPGPRGRLPRPAGGRPPPSGGRADHRRPRPDHGRAREEAADHRLARGRAPARGRPRRVPRRRSSLPAPLQRGPPLRTVRHRLRGPLPRPLLLQPPRGRLPHLQGLRAHHGDRSRARRSRPAQDDRPGLREAVPDDLL